MLKLTSKQKSFCENYLIDLNATQAATRAGYSVKSARFIGCENLIKPNIQTFISDLRKELEIGCGISKTLVLKELNKIMNVNISGYYHNWGVVKQIEELTEDQLAAVREVKMIQIKDKDGSVSRSFEYKLFDKLRAIRIINQML
jgi:phage terminase small subunit